MSETKMWGNFVEWLMKQDPNGVCEGDRGPIDIWAEEIGLEYPYGFLMNESVHWIFYIDNQYGEVDAALYELFINNYSCPYVLTTFGDYQNAYKFTNVIEYIKTLPGTRELDEDEYEDEYDDEGRKIDPMFGEL